MTDVSGAGYCAIYRSRYPRLMERYIASSFHMNRGSLSAVCAAFPVVVVDDSESHFCLFGRDTNVEDADADADSGVGEARLYGFRDVDLFSSSSFISFAGAAELVDGMRSLLYFLPQVGSKLIMTIARALPRPIVAFDRASVM